MTARAASPAEANYSAAVELHEDSTGTRLDLDTNADSVDLPEAGAYLVFLVPANSAVEVFYGLGTTLVSLTAPNDKDTGTPSFRGDMVERVRAKGEKLTLSAKLSSGTGTLKAVLLR